MRDDKQAQMERVAYTTFCKDFKLKPEWLDRKFEYSGKTHIVVGLNIRSKTYPVITNHARFNADFLRGVITGDMASIEKEREQQHEKGYQQARKDYPRYCASYGLEPSWLDKTFVDRRTTWRIDGLKLSSRKYPVVCRRVADNKAMFFNVDYLTRLMNPQHPAKAK